MKKIAATIITPDYIDRALLLNESLNDFEAVDLRILVVGDHGDLSISNKHFYGEVKLYSVADIHDDFVAGILERYAGNLDCIRWALKPSFILHLLRKENIPSLLYLDCDLYFTGHFDFLYYELTQHGILLTPHWRTRFPTLSEPEFEMLFQHGIFNAGFVGASHRGIKALEWWREACAYRCEITPSQGFYVDQKYLDAMPAYYPEITKVIQHRGCNVAIWNQIECKRSKINEQVLINGLWPLVFLHMSVDTMRLIRDCDKALINHLEIYEHKLMEIRLNLAQTIGTTL